MGLFDIFRRRAKKHKSESEVKNTATQSASTLSQSQSASQVPTPAAESNSETVSQSSQSLSSLSQQPNSTVDESSSQVSPSGTETSSLTDQQPASLTPVPAASVEKSTSTEESKGSETEQSVASETSQQESTAEKTSESSEASSNEVENEASSEANKEAKYEHGLAKSRHGFGARLNAFLANFRHVDEDFFDDLEDLLIESDVGYEMTMKLSDELRQEVKLQNAKSKQQVSNVIIEKMVDLYEEAGKGENPNINFAKSGPTVIMFVGVNGAGKTTTIGKMAAMYKRQGKKVLLAAADTFRAGAVEQLDVWAQRDGVDIVRGPVKGDPAAVVYDAVKKAKDENYDILFVDTAGRLQNKVNLMKELNKMKRVLTREIPDAPHEVLLVLDATTGQNALNQAKDFQQATDVTGIVLTKLDGTARGGIVLAIRNELHLPVKYVGLGEHVDDLQKFDANEFVYGLFKGLVTPEE